MHSFLFSFIHFVQQILSVCHVPGPVPGLECDGVQLTVPEVTFRRSLAKGEGNSCGKMEAGGKAFQVEEQHMGRL